MYAKGLICRCFDRLLLLRESTSRPSFSGAGLEDLYNSTLGSRSGLFCLLSTRMCMQT